MSNDDVNLIVSRLRHLELAIFPDASPARDAGGNFVASLTEAVMGVTGALSRIADKLDDIHELLGGRE